MGRLFFLGPEGTFTHQAALGITQHLDLTPLTSVEEVYSRTAESDADRGLVPIENSVEGYVVPSLDALLRGRVAAIGEAFVDITFSALRTPASDVPATVAVSHPHALAQCRDYLQRHRLGTRATDSTAAACRDLAPNEVAIAAPLCASLYGLDTADSGIEDFHGATTRFLLLASRAEARKAFAALDASDSVRTMYAVTLQIVGPGALRRMLGAFGDRGINLTSLISRPLKGQEARYTFVLTAEVHPHSEVAKAVTAELMRAGDYVLTLGAFPSPPRPPALVSAAEGWNLGATFDSTQAQIEDALLWP